MYKSVKGFISEQLIDIKKNNLYKTERVIISPQNARIRTADGRKMLNLCANNYLGLANDPRIVADAKLFASGEVDKLRAAVADFSMLLTKGYADKSALKLVGDRFELTSRQRLAVLRGSCSEDACRIELSVCVD